MALPFSAEQNWAHKKALAFAFCENKKGLREQINSCSFAHLSHFLTLTNILSKETRKRETRNMSQDCSPLPASLLPRKGCTGGQLRVAAGQGPAQLLPGAPCPGQRSPLASSAPHPLSSGALDMHRLRSLLPDPSWSLLPLFFCFPSTTGWNVRLS